MTHLLTDISYIVGKNDYNLIENYKNSISRENIINIIELIRNNKYKFKINKNIFLYNKIIRELHNSIQFYSIPKIEPLLQVKEEEKVVVKDEEKNVLVKKKVVIKKEEKEVVIKEEKLTEEEIYNFKNEGIVIDDIETINDLVKSRYLNLFLEEVPELEVIVSLHNDNKYESKYVLVSEPCFNVDKDKTIIINIVRMFLKLVENEKKPNKVLLIITQFNYLFRNYQFITEHKKFAQTFLNKITEFINEDYDKITDKLKLYYDKVNFLEIWKQHLEKLVNNNNNN